jgi:hypothetical protein
MGNFETSFASGSCAVKWRGNPTLAVEQCKTALAPQSVPIVVGGITYAVWATESCSSGGACAGMQFYAVTTDGSRAWASPAFGQGYQLTRILPRADGITLHLESATKGAEPVEFELRMGEVREASPTVATAPSDEAPRFIQLGDGCALSWQNQVLMGHLECGQGAMAPLGLEKTVRAGNTNFYIYGTPSAGGGNACDGDTYFVVTVTATEAWISEGLGGCAELGETSPTVDGISLTLSTPTGTTTCEVKPDGAKCLEPVAPAEREIKVLSKQTKTITGVLTGGSHADNWLYSIKPSNGGHAILIANEGTCAVNVGFEPTVEIRLSCVTGEDQSTVCTCEKLRVLD